MAVGILLVSKELGEDAVAMVEMVGKLGGVVPPEGVAWEWVAGAVVPKGDKGTVTEVLMGVPGSLLDRIPPGMDVRNLLIVAVDRAAVLTAVGLVGGTRAVEVVSVLRDTAGSLLAVIRVVSPGKVA